MNLREIYPGFKMKGIEADISDFFNSLVIRTNFQTVPRYRLGWRGIKYSCRSGEAWTCKIAGREGVYGIWCCDQKRTEKLAGAKFSIAYFPTPDEEVLNEFALDCAALAGDKNYSKYIREFLSYPGFYESFYLGDFCLTVSSELDSLSFKMICEERKTTRLDKGISIERDGRQEWIIEPGGIDQDLAVRDLIYPFYEVLTATLSYNLIKGPEFVEMSEWLDTENQKFESLSALFGNSYLWEVSGVYKNRENYTSKTERLHRDEAQSGPYSNAAWWKNNINDLNKNHRRANGSDILPELIILTGFLGAGKTSFLKNYIEYHNRNRRFVAVIQNEIGETGLDSKLLEDSFAVMEMDEGCICCSLLGNLKTGVAEISQNYRPDIIVLETTGLANPKNLLGEIECLEDWISGYRIITLVDAPNFEASLAETSIVADQVSTAGSLLINKIDMLAKGKLSELKAKLRDYNSDATIHECSYGYINPAQLFSSGDLTKEEQNNAILCNYAHKHSDDGYVSKKINLSKPLNKDKFLKQIKELDYPAYRIKGLLSFEGIQGKHVFQYVNGKYDFTSHVNNESNDNYLIFIGNQKTLSELKSINF